jgi:cytochrome P450
VASSPDAAREIMKTHDPAFASRPVGPMSRLWFQGSEGLVFAPYGDGWRQLRKICTQELLSARRVHSFRPVRQDELRRLLRSVASPSSSSCPVNLTEIIAAYVADSTVRAIIGSRPFKGRDSCLKLFEDMFRMMPGLSLPDLFPSSRIAMLISREPGRIKRCRHAMLEIMDAVIQEHRERKATVGGEDEDLVDVLLGLQKEVGSQHPLTTENIKFVMIVRSSGDPTQQPPISTLCYACAPRIIDLQLIPLLLSHVQDMFAAGSETATTALQWMMAELMRNPRVRHKAQEEVRREMAGHREVSEDSLGNLQYLHMVIKETLRLHVPGPLLTLRQCRNSCQVLGYDVPEGATVLVNAWAIARDPAHWDAPEEFVPERFEQDQQQGGGRDFKGTDFEFIPFGSGRRMCPGMTFGLAHIELALAALLFHFDLELPGGVDAAGLDMTEEAGITTRRKSDLLVLATTRVPIQVE